VTCLACGFKDNDPEDRRCARCGRRIERTAAPSAEPLPPAPPPPAITGSVAPAWKQEVAERFEQFRNRRTRQRGLFDEAPEADAGEAVPPPDLSQKVVPFEDFAADRIDPVIVPPPPPATPRRPSAEPPSGLRGRKPPDAALTGEMVTATTGVEDHARELLCPYPVTPVALRALAGLLDLSVVTIALGVFFATFHLLGGAFHFNERAGVGFLLAGAGTVGFYFFLYVCYGAETPGLQWLSLRVMDYEGRPPTPVQRLLRAVGLLLSAAALGLGYFWSLIDEENLTWHDRMSQTFVTRDPQIDNSTNQQFNK